MNIEEQAARNRGTHANKDKVSEAIASKQE
jgi:hypothetical protein